MSAGHINFITGLWEASLAPHNDSPPFKNAKEMFPGKVLLCTTMGLHLIFLEPDGKKPPWTTADYDIWFHDPCLPVHEMIGNLEFKGEFGFIPYPEHNADSQHHFENFMSGDWAWKQVVSGTHCFNPLLIICII